MLIFIVYVVLQYLFI